MGSFHSYVGPSAKTCEAGVYNSGRGGLPCARGPCVPCAYVYGVDHRCNFCIMWLKSHDTKDPLTHLKHIFVVSAMLGHPTP
jgi:hypothetical protein